MAKVKVSVVMAVYNAQKYLGQALDSILSQTLREIEVICVEDGSTDESLEILQGYAERDWRVRVLQNREPSDGAGAARNLGMSRATGEYLSVLDADDFFEPNLLERAYREAVDKEADIVLYDAYCYDDVLKRDMEVGWVLSAGHLPEKGTFQPQENKNALFQMTLGAAWNFMVSRSLVEKNHIRFESIHHADDLGFVSLCLACARRIAVLKERLLHYRRNTGGSQYSRIEQQPLAGCQALFRLRQELEARSLYGMYRVAFANRALDYLSFYLDEMKKPGSFEILYEALQKEYLGKLGLLDIRDEEIHDRSRIFLRNQIRDGSACAYWMKKHQIYTEEHDSSRILRNILPRPLPEGASVAVYGAGKRGWHIFSILMGERKHRVRAWVDREYQRIGYPVQPTETLRHTEFDCVLIAIKAEKGVQEAREYMLSMGIDEGRIYWTS